MKVRYTARASKDLEAGIAWYAAISSSLAEKFIATVEAKVSTILANPRAYQLAYKNYRSAFLQQFPFSLIYSIEEQTIFIHAIFDNRQNPNKRPN